MGYSVICAIAGTVDPIQLIDISSAVTRAHLANRRCRILSPDDMCRPADLAANTVPIAAKLTSKAKHCVHVACCWVYTDSDPERAAKAFAAFVTGLFSTRVLEILSHRE
jgi:hypothetical protein